MSEQEEKSGGGAGPNTSVVMVKSSANKYKQPIRPTEMQEESPDLHHKRSRAPAVPSVAEELKNISLDTTTNENTEIMEQKDSEGERKRRVSKKLSSSTKKRNTSPETITLQPIELDTKKGTMTPFSQPIPPEVESITPVSTKVTDIKEVKELSSEKSSVSEDIAELHTETKKHSEWSDDEEAAGGLPRSDSRASRVSRTIRQLLCCGVRVEAPSEDSVSSPRKPFGI